MTPRFVLTFLLVSSVTCRHHQHYTHSRKTHSSSGNQLNAGAASGARLSDDTTRSEPYTRRRPGRHVCASEKAVPEQMQTTESYSKPAYLTYKKKCLEQEGMCIAVRTVYHEAFRTVYKTQIKKQTSYSCCPGWTQVPKHQHGCRKAVCTRPCQNGGSCVKPDTCACPPGYTGSQCETDVDECQSKPCDQKCINTEGSFRCVCRQGFVLLDDERSCRSEGNVTATEATDLVDFELISQRLSKLEEEMHIQRQPLTPSPQTVRSIQDLHNKIEVVLDTVSRIKEQLDNIKRQQDGTNEVIGTFQSYRTEIERINPLCNQVATIEHKVQSCNCRSGVRYRYRPYNLS